VEEHRFGFVPSDLGLALPSGELAKERDTAPPALAIEAALELGEGDHAVDLGLVEGALERWPVCRARKVQDRSQGGGDGQALVASDVAGVERAGSVNSYALARTRIRPWDGYIELWFMVLEQPCQAGCREMAEDRAGRAREEGSGLERERRRSLGDAHEVHAAVKSVKATAGNAMRNRGVAEPELSQLPMGHDRVLPARQSNDPLINRHNVDLDLRCDEVSVLASP
jgi:hypothetical protein